MEDNSLRRLRKAAGWPTAKAFAESIGVPAPTYARYEQSGDGPDTNIPMKAAFTIADALGCSIDAIVGRERAEPDAVRGDMQRRYDALSDDGKQLVDDFLNMAEMREDRARKLRQSELARVYMKDARKLELQFLESLDEGRADESFMFLGTSDDMRAAFEEFALDMATAAEADAIERRCEAAIRTVKDPDEEKVAELRRKLEEESDAKIEGVVEGIMAAYDSMHAGAGDRVEYAVVDLRAER
ncbi:MAG: helix-turn-helix transcriptional regulator [Eggerthellaceae bacterium]|nr:helix-turn-helix transcriptional regulator [Eggerthellaceae bacterium]